MRRWLLLLCMLLYPLPSYAGNTLGTSNNFPDAMEENFATLTPGYVVSGCLPPVPSSSLTLGALACTAMVRTAGSPPRLTPVVQMATAIGPLNGGNGTYWLAVHPDTKTVVASWTRSAGGVNRTGSHYLWQFAASLPAAPANGLIVAKITVAGSVVTAVDDYRMPASYARRGVFDVTDPLYGAVDDNATNARAAITAAMRAASVRGGTVYFPFTRTGSYYVSGADSKTVAVPAAGANYQPQDQALPYQFYVESITGLRFVGDGVRLRSDYTAGGNIFLFNGCRDLVWDGITLESVAAYDGAGATTVAGMNGLAFTATTQDSERIILQNFRTENVFTGLYVFGSPASSYRVRGMTIQNALFYQSHYGMAFHDNGYNVTFHGVRTLGGLRSYFIYGVYGHDGDLVVDAGLTGFNAILIKAYDVNTEDITLKVRYNRASTSHKVEFSSQHNLAAQPTPGKVRNIVLDYDEFGFAGGGGLLFTYYQDATLQVTSGLSVFDNITLRGVFENDILAGTLFTGAGRVKLTLADTVFISGQPSILNTNQGFYATDYRAYVPELFIGGVNTGITYLSNVGEFFEVGNLVFGTARLRLSSKGVATGAVTFTIPRPVAAYTVLNPVVSVFPVADFASLTGAVIGFLNTSASYGSLAILGATGQTGLTDANLTDTSDILITFMYPK